MVHGLLSFLDPSGKMLWLSVDHRRLRQLMTWFSHIMRCGTVGSRQSAATFEVLERCWSRVFDSYKQHYNKCPDLSIQVILSVYLVFSIISKSTFHKLLVLLCLLVYVAAAFSHTWCLMPGRSVWVLIVSVATAIMRIWSRVQQKLAVVRIQHNTAFSWLSWETETRWMLNWRWIVDVAAVHRWRPRLIYKSLGKHAAAASADKLTGLFSLLPTA